MCILNFWLCVINHHPYHNYHCWAFLRGRWGKRWSRSRINRNTVRCLSDRVTVTTGSNVPYHYIPFPNRPTPLHNHYWPFLNVKNKRYETASNGDESHEEVWAANACITTFSDYSQYSKKRLYDRLFRIFKLKRIFGRLLDFYFLRKTKNDLKYLLGY